LIVIKDFKGTSPAISPKLLPDNFAQTAKNCDLRTGKLKALKDLETTKTWAALGAIQKTLYKDETADRWLYWTDSDIKVVKGQLADGDNRLFYTGDGYPKQTDDTLFPGSGKPANTGHYRRLGVVAPTTKLSAIFNGSAGSTKYTVAYYYTYVCKWDDGTEEESEPNTASDVFDVPEDCYASMQGFVQPNLGATGNNVTHFRVYRLTSSVARAEFQLVKIRPASKWAAAVYDIPIADLPLVTTPAWDCNESISPAVPDDLNDDGLGEVCPTEGWDAAPADLAQLGQYTNGMIAGFSGSEFCVSEPFVHYAWPEGNRIAINYELVAWGTYRGMAIIATTAFPSIITGADSSTLLQEVLPYNQGCLSARGFIITDVGAIYPSPDGLVLTNETGATVLTRKVLTKEQWGDLPPAGKTHADLVSFYYDNYYIGFWQGSAHGFIFNFKDNPYLITFETNSTMYHGSIDPTNDTLYLLTYAGTTNYAKAWEGAATYLSNTFKSKIFTTPPANYAFAKIIGNQSAGTPVTFKLFGDESQLQHGGGDWSKTVQNVDIFRLPAGQKYETHEIEVSGSAEIDYIILGTSGEEMAKVAETLS
jgi:hypothetical protein